MGTETDGSIVTPSGNNLIVGLKPTVGLVPQEGIIPIGHSQDTAGPMARSVTDIAILLGVLVWLGFGATFKAAQVAFERRPWGVWGIQAIHDVIAEVVVAGIVTLWR